MVRDSRLTIPFGLQVIKVITVISILLVSADTYAQKKFLAKVDSLLRDRYYNVKIDTDYLQRPDLRWNIRLGCNVSSSGIEMYSKKDGKNYHANLKADRKVTASVKVSYSGLSLSLSINPASFSGKDTDWGLNLNSYGRKIGADVTASISKTMKGNVRNAGTDYQVKTGEVEQYMICATGYYAFNDRRFSYAAAFAQSYIQKRSAGSWLLTAAIYASNIKKIENNNGDNKLSHFDIALGGGYGYNWVPGKRWLLHFSATPALCLYSYGSMTVNGHYEKEKMHFPEFIITGKAAVIYQSKKWFLGANMILYTSINGDDDLLRVLNTRWHARGFIGFRF